MPFVYCRYINMHVKLINMSYANRIIYSRIVSRSFSQFPFFSLNTFSNVKYHFLPTCTSHLILCYRTLFYGPYPSEREAFWVVHRNRNSAPEVNTQRALRGARLVAGELWYWHRIYSPRYKRREVCYDLSTPITITAPKRR